MTQFNQMTDLWIFVPCPNRVEPPKSVSYLNFVYPKQTVHPDPDTAKQPVILDPVDGFHFHDFVRHVASVPGRLPVAEDKNARCRNVWQWLGRPVIAPVSSGPYNDFE